VALESDKGVLQTRVGDLGAARLVLEARVIELEGEVGVLKGSMSEDDAKLKLLDMEDRLKQANFDRDALRALLDVSKKALSDSGVKSDDLQQALDDCTAARDGFEESLVAEQLREANLRTHVDRLKEWGTGMQTVAQQQYAVCAKISEFYGAVCEFVPPSASMPLNYTAPP
jgi:chromosome segregation ATPase